MQKKWWNEKLLNLIIIRSIHHADRHTGTNAFHIYLFQFCQCSSNKMHFLILANIIVCIIAVKLCEREWDWLQSKRLYLNKAMKNVWINGTKNGRLSNDFMAIKCSGKKDFVFFFIFIALISGIWYRIDLPIAIVANLTVPFDVENCLRQYSLEPILHFYFFFRTDTIKWKATECG